MATKLYGPIEYQVSWKPGHTASSIGTKIFRNWEAVEEAIANLTASGKRIVRIIERRTIDLLDATEQPTIVTVK